MAQQAATRTYNERGFLEPPIDPDLCRHDWLKDVRPWPRTDFHVGECADCHGTFACDELGRVSSDD